MKKIFITAAIMVALSETLMPRTEGEKIVNEMSADKLIKEYALIEKNKSKLTKSQQTFVVFKIDYLIEEGYVAKAA